MMHGHEEIKIEVDDLEQHEKTRHMDDDEGSGLLDEDLDEEQTRFKSQLYA